MVNPIRALRCWINQHGPISARATLGWKGEPFGFAVVPCTRCGGPIPSICRMGYQRIRCAFCGASSIQFFAPSDDESPVVAEAEKIIADQEF